MSNIPVDIRLASYAYSLSDAIQGHSAERGDRIALLTAEEQLSYRALEYHVREFAAALQALGIGEDTIVWCFLPRHFDFVVTFIAVQRLNATFAPFARDEVPLGLHPLSLCIPPSAFVYDINDEEGIETIARMLNVRMGKIASLSSAGATLSRHSVCRRCEVTGMAQASSIPLRGPNYLNFTSGTTSSSKAAVCTADNIFWNTKAVVERLGLGPADVHLCTFPVHVHPHEIFARAMYLGGTAVLMDFADLCSDLDQVNQLGVTCVMSTPSLYDVMLRLQVAKRIEIRTLKLAESGGAITPGSLIKACYTQNGVVLTPVWGSAETSGVAMVNPDPLGEPKGLRALTPYYESEVVSPSGVAGIGERGELRLRGSAVSQRYATVSLDDDNPFRLGWYHTGDICRVVSEAIVVFEDRRTDAIKSAGMTVLPTQVEAVLRELVGVCDAAVFGIEDERKGEILAAAVVRRGGDTPSTKEIVAFCSSRLPPFSIPQHFEFLDSLPYEPAGKLSRKILRALVSERIRRRKGRDNPQEHGSSERDQELK